MSTLIPLMVLSMAMVPEPTHPLHWIEGCWETPGGQTRETWTLAAQNLVFGHSVVKRDGETVFFEQLRFQWVDDAWRLYAYPEGRGPTLFHQAARKEDSLTVANAEHDYPQVIRYKRRGIELVAEISRLDGTKPNRWTYRPCASS